MRCSTPRKTTPPATQPISFFNTRCPSVTSQTACDGNFSYSTSADTTYYMKFTSPEIVSTIRGENNARYGGGFGRTHLWRKEIAPVVGLTSDGPVLLVRAEPTIPDLGACSQVDGISVSIDGRPELKPTYYDESNPPKATTATATSKSGLASFRVGLTGGTSVMVSAQKAGCSVLSYRGNETGVRPLEDGFVTMVPVTIGAL